MDQCPHCGKAIWNTPESDAMASRLNLTEEKLHGAEGENQRIGYMRNHYYGALVAALRFLSNDGDVEGTHKALGVIRSALGE